MLSMRLRVWSIFGSMGHTAGAVVANSSVGIKAVCLTVLVGYLVSFSEWAVRSLSLTPGYFMPPNFHFWTAFTYCFLEIHWWEVVVDILTLIFVGKLLEPLWGALEMVTFFVVVNASVALVCSVFYYFLFLATHNQDLLFEVRMHGLAGYLAGVSVAVKQAMPDHILYRSPLGKFTNRNIPLTVFGLSCAMWAVGVVEGSYCTMFGSGLVVSWTYLRFYQMHANGSRGDSADSFAFACFFPNVVQPPLQALANGLFNSLVALRVCKRPVRRYDVGGASLGVGGSQLGSSSVSISLPGSENHDTERRRQIALKALSDRLSKADVEAAAADATATASAESASSDAVIAWPTLDDEEEEGHHPKKKEQLQHEPPPVVHSTSTAGAAGSQEGQPDAPPPAEQM